MVPFIGIEVTWGVAAIFDARVMVRTVAVPKAGCAARVCRHALVRGSSPGMNAGQHHREDAEKDDNGAHALPVSKQLGSAIDRTDALCASRSSAPSL